jgi:hypothetical protein
MPSACRDQGWIGWTAGLVGVPAGFPRTFPVSCQSVTVFGLSESTAAAVG